MKLKKGTAILLALLVLTANTGLAFSLHYCGGSIARVSYGYATAQAQVQAPESESCCAAKAKENESCCKDKLIKPSEKSEVVVKTVSFQFDAAVWPNWTPEVLSVYQNPVAQPQPAYRSYQPHGPPLYALYSQRLFYA